MNNTLRSSIFHLVNEERTRLGLSNMNRGEFNLNTSRLLEYWSETYILKMYARKFPAIRKQLLNLWRIYINNEHDHEAQLHYMQQSRRARQETSHICQQRNTTTQGCLFRNV